MNNGKFLVMNHFLRAWIFILILIVTSGFAYAESKPQYGGILKYCDQDEGELIGFPPLYKTITYGVRQVAPAVETLVRIDGSGKIIPWLADEVKENAEDKAIILNLKNGIKFHDGSDFNAEAVKWNLDQHMKEKSQGALNFKSIDVINDYSVRINLNEWDNTTTENLASNVGLIISPTSYKKNGREWSQDNPVGTGPFKFVSWQKSVRMVYKKFDGYWQEGKPYLDGIEVMAIRDSLTRQLSLRKGEIDIALRMPSKDLAALEKDGFSVIRMKIASGAYGLAPDSANQNSPFADVRVRRAVSYALDTKTICETIFAGEVEPANQYIYEGNWAYDPSIKGYPYNPGKAKELLAEAGYPKGFKTKIIYRTTPEWDELFTAVQAYLAAVGIQAELVPMQYPGFMAIAYRSGKWDGLIVTVVHSKTDTAAVLMERFSGKSSFYSSVLYPPDYVEALEKAISAPNFDLKQKYTHEAMKLMIDKYCLQNTIYSPIDPIVTQPYVHNHGAGASAANALWTPEDAWKEKR